MLTLPTDNDDPVIPLFLNHMNKDFVGVEVTKMFYHLMSCDFTTLQVLLRHSLELLREYKDESHEPIYPALIEMARLYPASAVKIFTKLWDCRVKIEKEKQGIRYWCRGIRDFVKSCEDVLAHVAETPNMFFSLVQ